MKASQAVDDTTPRKRNDTRSDTTRMNTRSSNGELFFPDRRPRSSDAGTADSIDDGRRKRPRLSDAGFLTPTSPPSTEPTIPADDPEIKTEEEQMQLLPLAQLNHEEQVLIYFSSKIETRLMSKSDLDKSSVLKAWVAEDEGLFHIMNPKLVIVEPTLFKVVLEFIQTSEYGPCIVERPHEGSINTRKMLDGLVTARDYSTELVRAGELYVLAEKFKVDGLREFIVMKITEASPQKYISEALLNFARIIFKRPAGEGSKDGDGGSFLENWTISALTDDFWFVMQNHCVLLRDIAAVTQKRGFIQRLLRARADLVDERGVGAEIQIIGD